MKGEGAVLALDRDPDAAAHLEATLSPAWPNLVVRQANFAELPEVLAALHWECVDGMMVDLGISSHQLEGSGRGFSFTRDEPLDMRMDPSTGKPAAELIRTMPERSLADLIYQLGEERASRRVARAIVRERGRQPIETSGRLAGIVARAMGPAGKGRRIHPATRTFQALRMAVNRELDNLADLLSMAPRLLADQGRLVVMQFSFARGSAGERGICPPAPGIGYGAHACGVEPETRAAGRGGGGIQSAIP